MVPFRNDLDAADARADQLEKELEEAERHAEALRAKQEGTEVLKPRRAKNWYRGKKLLAFPALVIGVFVGLPAMGNLAASSCGYRAAVINAAQNCPEARELLGDDIRFGHVGLACGTTSINDRDVGYDYASWRMPIRGSESSGVYHFNVEDHGRGWSMGAGRIEVDGRTIELSECSADSQAASNGKSIAEVLIATCEEGEARACRDVSLLYEMGNTVEKNAETAKTYADKACKLGHSSACTPPSSTKE